MRRLLLLAATTSLAGCAYPSPQHVNALNALVGKSETDLIRSYGVPNRTYESGGQKFLAYSRSRLDSLPGSPGFGGPWGYGYGYGGYWGGWGGFPPEVVQRDCETTFDLAGGVVRSWSVRGNDC